MDLVAKLPWWAGIVLALSSYFILHAVATAPLPEVKTSYGIGQLAVVGLWRGLANAGQYILPFCCVIGALASTVRRRERRKLVETAIQSQAADALQGISWKEFELLVGEGFRRQGYSVTENGGGGADGGVDLILTKDGERYLVQCKQWRAFKVGVSVIRELYGLMAAGGVAGGIVVTSGRFTSEAVAFAGGRNIRLIDGGALLQLVRHELSPSAAVSVAPPRQDVPANTRPASVSVSCPVCDGPMVQRLTKRGTSSGKMFWGCSTYPDCKGTRPI